MNFFRRKASGLPCPAGPIPPGRTRKKTKLRGTLPPRKAPARLWTVAGFHHGAAGASRTHGLPLTRRLLCQLSYGGGKQKIKRTGLLQPSGASDPGGREGGRPQLPAVGKECMHKEITMRFRGPVTGSRMLARRAGVKPAARGFGDRRSALSYRRIQKEPRVSPSVALRVQYTSPAIGTSRNSFEIFG